MYLYSVCNTPCHSDKYTGYEMYVSDKSEIVKVVMSPYSKEKGGYYDVKEKHPGEEGFEELVRIVFFNIRTYSYRFHWQDFKNLKKDHPDLFATLEDKIY